MKSTSTSHVGAELFCFKVMEQPFASVTLVLVQSATGTSGWKRV